jgi:hypothetical protein
MDATIDIPHFAEGYRWTYYGKDGKAVGCVRLHKWEQYSGLRSMKTREA